MEHPEVSGARDVDQVIAVVKKRLPHVRVRQLQVKSPADDDGLWFFNLPDVHLEVQVESSSGGCPFLIENDASPDSVTSDTVEDTVSTVVGLLEPDGR